MLLSIENPEDSDKDHTRPKQWLELTSRFGNIAFIFKKSLLDMRLLVAEHFE